MKIETNYKKKNFYTEQEVKEIREKMSDIKLPNNHRNMKITDLIKEYGAEKARKLVEEEVYLFKHSLIMLELSEGYKMIYTNMLTVLKNIGVTEIECLHKPFDPKFMDAVLTESIIEEEQGVVLDVLQKGYMYKDKLLRPAMVKVNE